MTSSDSLKTAKSKHLDKPINKAASSRSSTTSNRNLSTPAKILTGPTYLTILRMLLSIAFMAFALLPDMWAKIVALVVFIIASITDKIDGIWARRQKLVTDLGAFLDPLADKMLVDLAFLALVKVDLIPVWVFAIILVRDLAIDGMRMMIARSGVTVAASFLGKLKTTIQMTALIVLQVATIFRLDLFFFIGYISLFVAVALTVISGADYLIKGWSKISHK